MVDKKRLAQLCRDKPANDQPIKLMLWELSDLIAKGNRRIPREDVRSAVWTEMAQAIGSCDASREPGAVFNYFYRVGLCAAMRVAKKWASQPPGSVAVNPDGGETLATTDGVTSVRAAEPLTLARRQAEALDPLQHIDRRLLRARHAIRHYLPIEPEYARLEMMIRTLQALRRDVAGEYLAMRTRTFRFTEARAYGCGEMAAAG